jgi:hypothetical protein
MITTRSGTGPQGLAAGHPAAALIHSFFYPEQFSARPALAALADVAQTHGRLTSPEQLADFLAVKLPCRLGAQDLIRAAESLGLPASIRRCAATDLSDVDLPVLLFVTPACGQPSVQVLARCDGKYVATRDHGSTVPRSSMGPIGHLLSEWAAHGEGWLLEFPVANAWRHSEY